MIFTSKYSEIFISLVLIYCITCPVFCFKLSEPNVLLPYNKGLPSNYTLEVTGVSDADCFSWKSSKPHVISITPLFTEEDCSKSAVLSSVAYLLEDEVTVITITERISGRKLYCEVYTDSVDSIEFQYVTDKIFLGSSLKVSLIARNKEGHKFNSISGLEIKYEVTTSHPLGTDVVKLTRFDTSEYASPEENELEKRGLLSCSVLIESLNVGTAVISASLHANPVLKSKDLTLTVLPNVKVCPSTLYLMRNAKVNVTLVRLRSEDESLEFAADVGDSSIVTFGGVLKEIHAKEYGSTSLKINNDDFNLDLNVHVVKLARIGFRVSNGDYNVLEELKVYEVFLDLFDENGNRIIVSDNLRLDVKFPPKLFHIIYTSANGSYFLVSTTAPGKGKVKAEFKGVILEDGSIVKENDESGNPISASMPVTVSQRLSIFPPYTLLPVLKQSPMHRISLKASGGTGRYIWSLNNNDVAKIVSVSEQNNTIDLEIYHEIYDLIVTLTDLGNINFISKAQVSCQVPLDLEAYPSVAEATVGNSVIVPVALLGYEDKKKGIVRKFDDCSMIDEIKIVDPYVISYEKEAYIPAFGKGCKSLSFQCRAAGHSRIIIEYTVDESRNISYKTTTVLACFKKLKPIYPVRISVLPLATSMDIAFEGGPRKWPLFKEGHLTELLTSDPELVNIELIKDPVRYNKDLTVFRVKCLALGENTLTFRIGNKASATLPHPAKAEESIKLICAEPHSLHLKLFRKKSRQKLDENTVKVPFYGEKIFEIDVYAKDKLGRKFANMSSLRIAWDVNDKTLAYPVSEFDFESFENAVSGYRKLSRNFMKFQMRGGTGELNVQAKITSYRKDILEKEGITKYNELDGEISTSIDLKLVSLRDLNGDLYDTAKEEKDEEGYCESDSCKS